MTYIPSVTAKNWRGTWWSPDQPDEIWPGPLYSDDDGRNRLELVGGFDTTIKTPLPNGSYTVGLETRDFPIIHGDSGGTLFTLVGNHHIHSNGLGFRKDLVKQNWTHDRALKGIHLADLDEKVFTRAHLQLERLLAWSDRSTLRLTQPMKDGKPDGERQRGRHDVPTTTASHDFTISLRVSSTEFNIRNSPVANRRNLESVEWATLDFDPAEPLSFRAFDTIDKDMQDLLTLASYAACGSHGQSLIFEASATHPGSSQYPNEVEVMGRQTYRTEVPEGEPGHHPFLFTLRDMDFPEIVPKWLALKSRARMGCNILFGLRYISSGYVGTRLLGVASAAENIHHSLLTTSTPLPKTQYDALKKKIMDAIRDESAEVRSFVKNGLRNQGTYRERMLELASLPNAGVVDDLLTDREQWATMLKNARNDLAHANERPTLDPDTNPAHWLLEVTYALLALVLLSELGLGEEVQRRTLQEPHVTWASARFKEALATGDQPAP